MKKLKLIQLEVLVAVAESGSFSGAALALDCTQSRISHSIAELEQLAGARLLTRSRLGCALTEPGLQVLAKARQILSVAGSIAGCGGSDKQLVATVKIACFRSVATHLLPYALEKMHAEFPGITVEIHDGCIDYSDVSAAVEAETADLGISRAPPGRKFCADPFISDAYRLVLPESVRLRQPFNWEQLENLPFIASKNAGAAWIRERCKAEGFDPVPARRLVNESGILALIGRGLGYSILPRLTTFPEPPGVKILDLPVPVQRNLALISLRDAATSPAARIARRFILDKRLLMSSEACKAGVIRVEF